MPKRPKASLAKPAARIALDDALGAFTRVGQMFIGFCFFLGGFFYVTESAPAAAAYWATGLLFTPWAQRWIERRAPEAARRRLRETLIAVLIAFGAFFLGH